MRRRSKKVKERVQQLNERFAEWYYVISDEVYRKIHLGRGDIVRKKTSTSTEGTSAASAHPCRPGGRQGAACPAGTRNQAGTRTTEAGGASAVRHSVGRIPAGNARTGEPAPTNPPSSEPASAPAPAESGTGGSPGDPGSRKAPVVKSVPGHFRPEDRPICPVK